MNDPITNADTGRWVRLMIEIEHDGDVEFDAEHRAKFACWEDQAADEAGQPRWGEL